MNILRNYVCGWVCLPSSCSLFVLCLFLLCLSVEPPLPTFGLLTYVLYIISYFLCFSSSFLYYFLLFLHLWGCFTIRSRTNSMNLKLSTSTYGQYYRLSCFTPSIPIVTLHLSLHKYDKLTAVWLKVPPPNPLSYCYHVFYQYMVYNLTSQCRFILFK